MKEMGPGENYSKRPGALAASCIGERKAERKVPPPGMTLGTKEELGGLPGPKEVKSHSTGVPGPIAK